MSAKKFYALADEDEGVESGLNLRLLLVAGLVVYLSVTLIVWLVQKETGELEDGEWLGKEAVDFAYDYGPPAEVEEDGQGGSILKYRRLQVIDYHYTLERFDVFVDPLGNITGIKREP